MTYVYLLSDYEESGAENVAATLERSRLSDVLKENWPEPTEINHDAPKPYWRQDGHKKFMTEALSNLSFLLEKTDEELARDRTSGWDLNTSWGGIQLHVIELK